MHKQVLTKKQFRTDQLTSPKHATSDFVGRTSPLLHRVLSTVPNNKAGKMRGAPSRNRTGTAEAERFSYHFGFHRRLNVRGLDYAFTLTQSAVGTRRLVSTRS